MKTTYRTIRETTARTSTTTAPLGMWSCIPQDDSERVFYGVGRDVVEACASVADEIAEESGATVHVGYAIFGDVTVSAMGYMADVIVRRV